VTLSAPGLSAHGLIKDDKVVFQEGGGPITPRTKTYVVLEDSLTANSFTIREENGPVVESDKLDQPLPGTLDKNPLLGRGEIRSPLLWLAQRMAKNRERLGV